MGRGYLCSMSIAESAGGSIVHENRLQGEDSVSLVSLPPDLSLQSNQIQAILESAPPLPQPFQPVFSCLLWSSWALWRHRPKERWACASCMLCRKRHFHTSSPPSLIPELPLRPRFISSWLLSVGYILKVELADKRTVTAYRSSGTFPECSSESSKQLKVLLAVISWACFPHIPGSVVALLISWYLIGNCLWYLIGKCVFWCLYCIIHVIYILKSNFYWHWRNFLYF